MTQIIKLRIFLWALLAITTGWLLYMAVAPSGRASYEWRPGDDNFFIGKLTPEERVQNPPGPLYAKGVNIVGEPVYFSLRTPRRFEKAKLILKYKNNSTAPIIEAGVLADKTVWRYDLKPIENKIIDELAGKWNVIKENGAMLLQRIPKFKSIAEFLNNLPPRDEFAVYNYPLKTNYVLTDYKPAEKEMSVDYALRGAYQFWTYVKDEDLDFKFYFSDLNKNKDSDPVGLNLYKDGELVVSRYLEDDGIAQDSGAKSEVRKIEWQAPNLAEGVYKIELKVNNDIITKKIITKQQKLSFINKIWLADSGGKNFFLYTDGKAISAQTINPARLQTIKIGDGELPITETYKQFSAVVAGNIKEIKLEQDDLMLAGDGVFSFMPGALINPATQKITENTNIKKDGMNYILTSYASPTESGGWKTAEVEFDISNAYRENQKYNFLISVPGLNIDDGNSDGVEIGEIKIKLEGRSLWEKLKDLRFKI